MDQHAARGGNPSMVRVSLAGTLGSGGDEGDRTPDLDSAIVALSQLSYVPELALSYHSEKGM